METIRPYEKKDCAGVRDICLRNAGNPHTEKQKAFILSTYCDYYIEKEPGNCFVAANDAGEAIGYIFCAEDYRRFAKTYFAEYPARNRKHGLAKYFASRFAYGPQKKYSADYPAHLHIDLLADYRRKGLGSRLVDTLAEHLRKKGVPGLMLTVGKGNQKGISFYKKYGFIELERSVGAVAMGIKIK